jgi:hypothetical protein
VKELNLSGVPRADVIFMEAAGSLRLVLASSLPDLLSQSHCLAGYILSEYLNL